MTQPREIPESIKSMLTPEQIERISGGELCTAAEYQTLFEGLKENYETLIDFTSYVIERVAGS